MSNVARWWSSLSDRAAWIVFHVVALIVLVAALALRSIWTLPQ